MEDELKTHDILVRNLCCATSTKEELKALRELNRHLSHIDDTTIEWSLMTQDEEDFIEHHFLNQSKTLLEEGNPYPGFDVSNLILPQGIYLSDLLNYILTRRYGWSEVVPSDSVSGVQRISGLGPASHHEGAMKMHLNELLDEFIKWLLCQRLSHDLLQSYKFVLLKAAHHPVIRKQTVIHMLDWFKSKCTVFHEEYFEESKELVLLGLTDFWSAIRSVCAAKLSSIVEQFSIKQLESFFQRLIEICQDCNSNWQSKEGAVLGLNVIIKRFQWIGFSQEDLGLQSSQSSESPRTEYYLKFGKEELQKIPEFISSQLHDVIFTLLADPQLSIREHATKAFSSYLSRCEFKEALSSFKEVVMALCKGAGVSEASITQNMSLSSAFKPDHEWMNAYAAEGLLGMCIFLVKHIPPGFLLPSWPLYFSTFSIYLMHPASTVRQATSNIFKFLVAKDTSKPAIVNLVLHALSSYWEVDIAAITKDCLPGDFNQVGIHLHENEHRIKNPSITHIHIRITGSEEQNWCKQLVRSWEWREGRLLAYELILQFLVKNHWLYTFGTFSGSRSQSNSISDDTMAASRGSKNFKPSQSQNVTPSSHLHRTKSSQEKANPNTTGNWSSNRHESTDTAHCSSWVDELIRPASTDLCILHEDTHKLPLPRSPNTSRSFKNSFGKTSLYNGFRMPGRVPVRRRATMDYMFSSSLKTLVRHYSYFEQPKAPFKVPGSHSIARAVSLITALHKQEVKSSSGDKSPRVEHNKTMLVSPLVLNGTHEEKDNWLSETEVRPMISVLSSMMLQTIECFDSSSWELRRMSHQVLPCLVEVIRWYDMDILVNFWAQYLTGDTNVLSYGACLSFFYSVCHAAKLTMLLNDPPDNWQNVTTCKLEVQKITDCIAQQIPLHLNKFVTILKRHVYDRLSVIAVQTIMLASTLGVMAPSQYSSCLAVAIDCIKGIAAVSNPTGRLARKLREASGPISLPSDGFLSCNPLKSENVEFTAAHLEKHLLEQIQTHLGHFTKHSSVQNTYQLLPVLALFLSRQSSADSTYKLLTESMINILSKIDLFFRENPMETMDVAELKKILDCKNECMYELQLLISDKNTDLHILRSALDIATNVLLQSDGKRYIVGILQAMNKQLSDASGNGRKTNAQRQDSHMEILSNDIRETGDAITTEDSESDDEEKVLQDSDHQESLTLHGLNVSTSSGGTISGRHSGLSQRSGDGRVASPCSGESDSDWDSWDEDEADGNNSTDLFSEFLKRLHDVYVTQERKEELFQSINKLPTNELQLIKTLMQI